MAYYFPASQSHALQYARTLVQIVTQKLLAFSTFDVQRFTAQFLTDFSLAINEAENVQDDETVLDQQSIKTQEVEDMMVQARKQFQELKYFVQKTFPNNANVWNKFGFDDYNDVRANAVKMIPFLLKVYKVADENRAALNVQGCPDARIDAFNTAYQALIHVVTEQDLSKNDRPVITQARRKALDFLFDNFVTPVREVGKLIYAEDAAMYAQFLLPKRNSNASNNDTPIAPNTQSAVFQDVSPSATLEIKNTGNAPLTAYIAPNETTPAPSNALIIAPNSTEVVAAQQITVGAGTVLVIWNPSNVAGSYVVTELEE
ncbi:MAG: hypothetical protein ACKVTZ_00760 [Bacteroidia bacterium]